jgi:hypothetical protein
MKVLIATTLDSCVGTTHDVFRQRLQAFIEKELEGSERYWALPASCNAHEHAT